MDLLLVRLLVILIEIARTFTRLSTVLLLLDPLKDNAEALLPDLVVTKMLIAKIHLCQNV